jgi:hypothetical protein
MSLTIRNVRNDDHDAALALNESVIPHVNSIDLDKMAWFAEFADYFRIAELDGIMTGLLVGFRPGSTYESRFYQWFCDNYADFAYIDRVAVAPHARRSGVARQLYMDFEKHFAQAVPALACEVNVLPRNTASMSFHRRLGFEQVEHAIIEPGVREVARLLKQTGGIEKR